MSKNKRILMVAAENDSLPGAKVGGVGDVLRDLPRALIREGMLVDVVVPSYGFLARLDDVELVGGITVKFSSQVYYVDVLCLRAKPDSSDEDARTNDNYILHHPDFSAKGESVYYHDDDGRPFASDANKFSFFSACVAQALLDGLLPRPDVLHCHDWHAAFVLMLIRFSIEFKSLRDIKSIYTIHNLAMQGIRPFDGDESSFHRWFPDLHYSVDNIADPRYLNCVNPMRAGIVLADLVHTVSPSYAREILQSSHHEVGIYGGDGLENDLKERTDRGELIGILNGCEYPKKKRTDRVSKETLISLMRSSNELWAARSHELTSAHWLAEKSIHYFENKASQFNLVSIGRLTEQKARVLHTLLDDGRTALEGVLDLIGDNGTFILLGSGNDELENFIAQTAAQHHNLIFLNGYSDELSAMLYRYGDLFLMPSSFEPCGISQMLAMRAGQPCLVNAVGGLKDTVKHEVNGFLFEGATIEAQAQALIDSLFYIKSLYEKDQGAWTKIIARARRARFSWDASAKQYVKKLYQ